MTRAAGGSSTAVETAAVCRHIVAMNEKTNGSPEALPPLGEGGQAEPGKPPPKEVGGPKGPEPTRYGDWEVGGRCTDF